MRQAMNTLKLLTTFNSSILSKNTRVVLPYRPFSTSHEKTITIEQHHFDLLKKESEVLSQQIQLLSSSINSLESKLTATISNLDNKFTSAISNLDNKFTSAISNLDNKFTSAISNLDNKFTTALQTQSNYLDMKLTHGLDSLRKEIKEENKALERKIESNNRHIIGTAIGLASLFFAYDQYNKEQNKKELKASLVNEAPAKPAEKSAFKFPSIFSSSHSTAKDSNVLPRA